MRFVFVPAAFVALTATAVAQLGVQDLNSGLTATDLANTLTGGGLTISNVTFSGRPECGGVFTGGAGPLGLDSGIVLATGRVIDAAGPNTGDSTSGFCGGEGDPDLDLLSSFPTRDRAVLEFDFTCPTVDFVTFRYVFASEEYNEYVYSIFNDVFAFYLNGQNVALLPDGVTPVTINNVNGGNPLGVGASNPAYFINNDLSDGGGSINIEYDGLTVVLEVNAPVTPGAVNHIKLAIADAGDASLDSAVFLEASSFTCGSGNSTPTCIADLDATDLQFVQPSPGEFIVTEDETFFFDVIGMDADGDNLAVSIAGLPGATVSVDTSGDNTVASVEWLASAAAKASAPYTAIVTFTDPSGESDSCEVVVADVNLRPDCSMTPGAGGTLSVQCNQVGGASVQLDAVATDGDDAVLFYQWDVSDMDVMLADPQVASTTGDFPLGTTMVTLTVTDGRGGVEMCDILVEVVDTTPPVLSCTTNTGMLWPPNHKMRAIDLVVMAEDVCMTPGTVSVSALMSSDEPDNDVALGDGNTVGDVNGFDGYELGGGPVDLTTSLTFEPAIGAHGAWVGSIELRAERDGTQDGRKYTLHVEAVDASGNTATTSCCVIVPHDKRHGN